MDQVAVVASRVYDACVVKGLLRAEAENPAPRLGTGAGGASGATAYRSRRRESASVGRTVGPQERRTYSATLLFFVALLFVLVVLLVAAGEARAQKVGEAPDPGGGQSPEPSGAASAPASSEPTASEPADSERPRSERRRSERPRSDVGFSVR